ncbi:hypothetical protein RB195_023843 [Necator americanus]
MSNHAGQSNGYPSEVFHLKRSHITQRWHQIAEKTVKIRFNLPFISDDMSNAVRARLPKVSLQNLVRVVDVLLANLKKQLVCNRAYDRICETPNCVICPNGRQVDCVVTGVIYLTCCQQCGAEYIDETGRALCTRVKEDLDGLVKSKWSAL